jgi:ribonucleoside-diphosphate reductase beta chain
LTTLSSRIELTDFFSETADPALLESADRGQTELLDYRQLYELWERQQWLTQELDFAADREHWQGFPDE